ncbi:unnamed protein product [Brassica oleracea]|uniref:RRM domain-containing protein n=1 Tax=Brassica carinata TaxID=52824 RepID=A0A8X7TXN3_BRACI|nr:hypothetical protein Bca52824_076560 [Brassica carinata]
MGGVIFHKVIFLIGLLVYDVFLKWAKRYLELLNSLLSSPSRNEQRHHHPPTTSSAPQCDGGPLKRPRFDLGHDMPSEGVGRFNGVGGGMGRPGGGDMGGGVFPPNFGPNGTRAFGFGQQDPSRELLRLPPDASSTLFVQGLPSNCSMREAAHIFRPFSGYKEVRLVTKGSKQVRFTSFNLKHYAIVLCFVDFDNPACAATARNALQGYRMDEEERDSKILHIQFSRNPGPRPGQRGGRR